MSTLEYNYNPSQSLTEADIRRIAREESGSKVTTVFYNPETGNFHLGLHNKQTIPRGKDENKSLWESTPVIANRFKAQEGNKRLSAGSLNADSARYMPYRNEFADKALQYYELQEKVQNGEVGIREAAGIIANSDYQSIANEVISNELEDLTIRDYVLEGAATRITSQFLTVALPDSVTSAQPVAKDLREFDIPDSHNITYAVAEMSLKKAAARFEISTWFDLTSRRHNVEADTKRQIELDFPRIYDEEIRARLLSFGNVAAGTAWDVTTTAPQSDINPTLVIRGIIKTIATAGGSADTMVMHPDALLGLQTNSYLREATFTNLTALPVSTADQFGKSIRMPQFPDLQIFTSRNITPVDSVFVYDRRAVKDIRGPTRIGNYEDILGSYRGTLYERWYGSAISQATWGKEITDAITSP